MKREVTREKILPAIRIDVAELGLLWEKLLDLFQDTSKVHIYLTVKLPKETLNFYDFEEFKTFHGLPANVTKFSLWFSNGNSHISIGTRGIILRSRIQVSVGGETEAWCAGAVETVAVFFSQHKAPYHMFTVLPYGRTYFLLGVLVLVTAKIIKMPAIAMAGVLSLLLTFALLDIFQEKLFPLTVITVRKDETFIQRHIAELTLFVAVVAAILTVVGWFVAK